VHFKDCHPEIANRARIEGWDYFEAVRHGIFCELGEGYVDFPAVIASLRDSGYCGWIVVEQDILPGMGTPRESALRNRDYLKTIGI
jgi:inosose dehydratase